MTSGDDLTIGELRRVLEAHQREILTDIADLRGQLERYVLREVYEAHRTATIERILRLEADLAASRETGRRAMWTAITSFIAPIIVAIVLAYVLRGGSS